MALWSDLQAIGPFIIRFKPVGSTRCVRGWCNKIRAHKYLSPCASSSNQSSRPREGYTFLYACSDLFDCEKFVKINILLTIEPQPSWARCGSTWCPVGTTPTIRRSSAFAKLPSVFGGQARILPAVGQSRELLARQSARFRVHSRVDDIRCRSTRARRSSAFSLG